MELLTAALHQSKRQIECLVASRFPQVDARFILRKLPACKAAPPSLPAAATPPSEPAMAGPVAAPAHHSPAAATNPPWASQSPAPPETPTRAIAGDAATVARFLGSLPASERTRLTPLAGDRYRLQIAKTRELRTHSQGGTKLLPHTTARSAQGLARTRPTRRTV